KDESTVTQKLTMEGDPAKTTVDLRCARRCSARAGTGAEISKSYVKELLTHYTSWSSFCRETRTPKGSSRTAQGASPGLKGQIAESPERAAQGVRSQLQINARHKAPLWYRDQLHRPFGASLLCLFPGLAPWAFLSRPCGASFAPET